MSTEHQQCLLSGSTDLRPLEGYEGLVKSSPLGFVFDRRIPTSQELQAHYAGYSRNDYLSPLTVKRYNELLDFFESFRKTGRILDLGCGVGYFLEEARKRGWETCGTEFTREAIDICSAKGIQMQEGKTRTDMFPAEAFDIVTSFEVIEHINYPLEEMDCVRHFLRRGGLFYCTTPNFNALERFRLRSAYRVIAYPEHLSYYTPRTFHYLMRQKGMKKVFLKTTGLSLSSLLGDERTAGAAGAVSAGSRDEKLREALDSGFLSRSTKVVMNALLSLAGVGNSLKAAYIKK